jgi:hypothetical protein
MCIQNTKEKATGNNKSAGTRSLFVWPKPNSLSLYLSIYLYLPFQVIQDVFDWVV